MFRRLPLLGTPPPETHVLGGVRTPLGPGSIGVADTDAGALAARFACDLAIAFSRHDTHVSLTVLGYEGVPVLDAGLVAELAACGVTPLSRAALGDTSLVLEQNGPERPRVDLFVGLPALGACRPPLSVLLGADRPVTRWPAVLRGLRGDLTLSLAAAPAGLAPLLATALIERGFLPRG
jgi:hypothetical protein